MPIVSQTIEEKMELLKQDTREQIEWMNPAFSEWSVRRTGQLQYADVVQFLRLESRKTFSAEEVLTGLTREALGRGGTKLLNEAKNAYDAQELVRRWEELPTWGQNGPELDKFE